MKHRYQSRGGQLLEADTAQAIIEQLRDAGPLTQGQTYEEYIAEATDRERIYSGQELDTTSPEAFVESAVASGLLTPLQ